MEREGEEENREKGGLTSFFFVEIFKFWIILLVDLYIKIRKMQTTILILIATAMVITTIVNFAKPAYEEFVGKYAVTINIAISFILGVCSAFAIKPYLEIELGAGALVLLGLALGTGANIFYDIWKLIQNLGSTKKDILIELPEEE